MQASWCFEPTIYSQGARHIIPNRQKIVPQFAAQDLVDVNTELVAEAKFWQDSAPDRRDLPDTVRAKFVGSCHSHVRIRTETLVWVGILSVDELAGMHFAVAFGIM